MTCLILCFIFKLLRNCHVKIYWGVIFSSCYFWPDMEVLWANYWDESFWGWYLFISARLPQGCLLSLVGLLNICISKIFTCHVALKFTVFLTRYYKCAASKLYWTCINNCVTNTKDMNQCWTVRSLGSYSGHLNSSEL